MGNKHNREHKHTETSNEDIKKETDVNRSISSASSLPSSSSSHEPKQHNSWCRNGRGIGLGFIFKNPQSPRPTIAFRLSDSDMQYLCQQTELNEEAIKTIFNEFCKNNPSGFLNKSEFVQLYCTLRGEPESNLKRISEFAFTAFDSDKNGFIDFKEFIVS